MNRRSILASIAGMFSGAVALAIPSRAAAPALDIDPVTTIRPASRDVNKIPAEAIETAEITRRAMCDDAVIPGGLMAATKRCPTCRGVINTALPRCPTCEGLGRIPR
jgi:hypothetical protein